MRRFARTAATGKEVCGLTYSPGRMNSCLWLSPYVAEKAENCIAAALPVHCPDFAIAVTESRGSLARQAPKAPQLYPTTRLAWPRAEKGKQGHRDRQKKGTEENEAAERNPRPPIRAGHV